MRDWVGNYKNKTNNVNLDTEKSGGVGSTTPSTSASSGTKDWVSSYKNKKNGITEPTTNEVEIASGLELELPKEEPVSTVDKWKQFADKNYKLTSEDKKEIEAEYKRLKKLGYGGQGNASAMAWQKALRSGESASHAEDVEVAHQRTNNVIESFLHGVGNSMAKPITTIGSLVEKGVNKATGSDLDVMQKANKSRESIHEANQDAHKIATLGGDLIGNLANYKAMSAIPAVGKVSEGVGKTLGGGKLAKSVGAITADTLQDIVLDTLPEIGNDVIDGKSGKEIAGDAAKNLGTNVLFNIGGEVVGNALGKAIDKRTNKEVVEAVAKKADDVADATKAVDETNPVTEAIKKRTEGFTDEGTVLEKDLGKDINTNSYTEAQKLAKRDYDKNVVDAFKENPQIYNVLHNADTEKSALDIVANATDDADLYRQFNDLLTAKDPKSVVIGDVLSKRYFDAGDYDRGLDVLESLASKLTEAGQFTQAAYITMTKNNPMASLRALEKNIQKFNLEGQAKFGKKWTDFVLTDADKEAFAKIKAGDSKAIQELYEDITKRMADGYPSTIWEQIVEASKTAMMLNPRTHIRNIAANTVMQPVRSLSDRVSALGQNAYHIINPDFTVTQSLLAEQKNRRK